MQKIVISVLGSDRPGIVAAVSRVLFENHCNIEDVSQTILQTEFAGIFIASMPEALSETQLRDRMQERLAPMGLVVQIKPMHGGSAPEAVSGDAFVITTIGPDRLGLVAGMTEVLARFGVNITNLKAAFRGGIDPRQNVMIYEVEIPTALDQAAFRADLLARARELDLDLSLQHKDIFEAIHRI